MGDKESISPGLAGLVDLVLQLRSDEELPSVELRRRDRAIGRELGALESMPEQQVLAWLSKVQAAGHTRVGPRVARVHSVASLLLVLAGLLLGWGTAVAVFHYDGTDPVNVIRVLAIFVGAQLLLLLLLGVTLLPPAVIRYLPGGRAVQDALALLSPGNLIRLGGRFVPADFRRRLQDAAGRGQAHKRLFGRVQRWGMVAASQGFAVAFNLGALAACLYLVTFSDLAFSWNTTLHVEPEQLHATTQVLSSPWAPFVPNAVPSFELIHATRYFRLGDGVLPDWEHPEILGDWWPFLVACIAFYGLLPRLILVGLARWRFSASVRRAILHLPAIPVLLSRLNSQLIETASPDPDSSAADASTSAPNQALSAAIQSGSHIVISWAGAPAPAGDVLQAGGANTLDQDNQLIADIAAGPSDQAVSILVKAWEPPVTEFVDFVSDLRGQIPAERPIVIRPLGLPDQEAPTPRHLAAWQRRIAQLGDPWTAVIAPEPAP